MGRTDPNAILVHVMQCTSSDCEEVFIARYARRVKGNSISYAYELSIPLHAEPSDFSEQVAGVSPAFVKIYDQAIAAEAAELDELAGMGMRKALEFLVKDFAASQAGEKDAERIRALPLGACIENYIDDPSLKSVAAG